MDSLKNAWKSLTIWFNSAFALALGAAENFKEEIAANLPMVQQYLTPEFVKYSVFAILAVNIALRFKTNKALADK